MILNFQYYYLQVRLLWEISDRGLDIARSVRRGWGQRFPRLMTEHMWLISCFLHGLLSTGKKTEAKLQNTGPLLKAYVPQVTHRLVIRFRGLSQVARRLVSLKPLPSSMYQNPKHWNETIQTKPTNETNGTAKTTETPELNNGNAKMKPPKRNH